MSRFITTTEISHNIELIIKDAKLFVILVTPYVNIHSRLKSIISKKLKDSDVIFVIICREESLKPGERKWLKTNTHIKVVNQTDLHAKCYLNEQMALITSMNLFEYSQVNNIEFGVIIEKNKTGSEYYKIKTECIELCPDSLIKKINHPILHLSAGMSDEELLEYYAEV
jgi:hypothetical protein